MKTRKRRGSGKSWSAFLSRRFTITGAQFLKILGKGKKRPKPPSPIGWRPRGLVAADVEMFIARNTARPENSLITVERRIFIARHGVPMEGRGHIAE